MRGRSLTLSLLAPVLFAAPAAAQLWESCGLAQTWIGESAGDQFGWVGVNAGDTDGDGANDVIIGAPFHVTGGANAGRAYLYSGATGALRFTFDGGGGNNLGYSVAGAGDTNGDGYDDVVIGGPAVNVGGQPGSARLYSGQDGSLLHTFVGESNGDQFGTGVNGAGDVNMDGYADVIVGAPQNDTAFNNAGRAYVYSGLDYSLLFAFEGEAANDALGNSVGTVGDRDSDGHDDVLAGAPNGGPGNNGRAYVHSGIDGSFMCSVDAGPGGTGFGTFFAGFAGDVNNDATPDFFVSDFGASNGAGVAFVYSGIDCSTLLTLPGAPGDGMGIGRGWAGDVNSDGHDDLFFGSWTNGDGANSAGKCTIHSGVDGSVIGAFTGDIAGDTLGFDAAGMGDVDGDGAPDFLLTAAGHMGNRGAVYLVYGQPAPPQNFCETAANSAGDGAVMTYRRSTSIADNTFRVRVEGAIPGEMGLFIYSFSPSAQPFGDGTLCLGGSVVRLRTPLTINTLGARQTLLDFTTPPVSAGSTAIAAGVRTYFQFWYRDPAAAGTGFNLSDGMVVTFCP